MLGSELLPKKETETKMLENHLPSSFLTKMPKNI